MSEKNESGTNQDHKGPFVRDLTRKLKGRKKEDPPVRFEVVGATRPEERGTLEVWKLEDQNGSCPASLVQARRPGGGIVRIPGSTPIRLL